MGKVKRGHLLVKIEEVEKPYREHLKKLKDVEKAGGYTSSIKKEIKAFRDKKDRLKRRL
ncbi:MAG TPA: hypothetical protein VKM55_09620 [Candidatus Lokiarchaeia archaeon]|nr:hypothetical protein [Candidatus Lokiarchaeia archaeon]